MISNALQQLDLKALTGLILLLEERHVGRAAQRMSLSQSAMSRLLMRLRHAFDDPLFIRTSSGMAPTAKALELEGPIKLMLEQMASMQISPDFDPNTSRRVFRLLTTHYQAQAYVPSIAERFYREAPLASLETTTITETSLLRQTEQSGDLYLCSEYIEVPNNFKRTLFGREKFRCIMSQSHPLANQPKLTLDDYMRYQHVLVNMGGSMQVVSDSLLGERAKERRFAFRTPYFMAALETVSRTQLLLSTSGLLPSRFQQVFGLVMKDLPFEFPDVHYYLCWPRTSSGDPAAEWFRQMAREVVQSLVPYPDHLD
ncbi:LysR family transcriptional regulator [Marinomonas aquiplantarum]|uniref:DNA-binding transcriptional LysR family regulator n=1 Tax=Marinomonas aquiplantarum TaxID=491951 RepID=A0A366D9U3_9GAMM|nr:LysR family transcriptional regulator [Marinomonas aquiplantarum]RBO86028.1 DNA-binding transcriptional LysR family regulator [Marinomonas aquiplantarum]